MEGQNKNMRWRDKVKICVVRANKNMRWKDKIKICVVMANKKMRREDKKRRWEGRKK